MNIQDTQKVKQLARERNMPISDLIEGLIATGYLMHELGEIKPSPLGYYRGFFTDAGATTGVQIIETTATHEIGIAYFQGNLMKFYRNTLTGQIGVDVDALAKTLGYEGAHDLLSQDKNLDLLNEAKKQTGVWPIQTL